jgi:PAS domain S-box-containing protein
VTAEKSTAEGLPDGDERASVEARLRHAEQRFRLMANSAPVLIWISELDKLCTWFNKPWLTFTGRTMEQESGNGWAEGVHPDDLQRCLDVYVTHFDRRDPFEMDYRLRRHDGEYRWVSDTGVPRFDEQGDFVGYIGSCVDITERKRAEEAARLLSAQLTSVLEGAGDVIAVMDKEFRYTVFNSAFHDEFLRIFGVSLLPGDSMIEALHRLPDDLAAALAYWKRALAGEDFTVTQQFGDPWLGRNWYELHFSPIFDRDHRVSGAVHVVRNVTERRAAEEALRASEQELRLSSDQMNLAQQIGHTGSWVYDLATDSIKGSAEGLRIFGFPAVAGAWPIADIEACIPEKDRVHQALVDLVQDGREYDLEYEINPANGGPPKTIHSVARVGRNEQGAPLHVYGFLQDVTERRRVQDALARERARYLSLMNIAQDGIHILDESGTLIEANDAFFHSIGQSRDAIGTLNVRDWNMSIPEDELVATIRALMEQPRLFESRHRRNDGSVFDAEVHACGIELEGQQFLLAASRDITARKDFERKLAAMNQSLEARVSEGVAELRAKDRLLITQSRQAAMGEMISNIAHQWRQPLNALSLILANVQDAARFDELDDSTLDKAMFDSNRLIQQMSSTINDFRNFFKPAKEKRAFSALEEVRRTVALVEASFEHAGIALEIEATSDLSLHGFANEYSQVLLNLISNAKEAIEQQQVAEGRVVLRLEARDGLGCVSVRDNGRGIAADVLDRIFEPYFSTKQGGTGIGLYMSRQIAEQSLGGRLEVRNVDGGAEFTVIAPLEAGRPSERPPAA